MKKSGLIDLPSIQNLVNNYQDFSTLNNLPNNNQEKLPINQENNSIIQQETLENDLITQKDNLENNPKPAINNTPINQTNQTVNNTTNNVVNNNLETEVNDIKNNENNRETVEMKAEITEDSLSNNNNNNQIFQTEIKYDIEKLVLELYLQEVAENLVKPSKKALKPIFQPNINEFLKDINH